MAKQEDALGCGLILSLGLVWLVISFWPLLLAIALVVGLVLTLVKGLTVVAARQRCRRLQAIAVAADRRFRGDVIRLERTYGVLEGITVEPDPAASPALCFALQLRCLESGDGGSTAGDAMASVSDPSASSALPRRRLLPPPLQLEPLSSMKAFALLLEGQGIQMVNDLSVEARATRAALHCASEADWARSSLATLAPMVASVRSTLTKAPGNELLEPSIPQLQQALASFEAEQGKCLQLQRESEAMLGKLRDFLSVPDKLRPILNFELDGLSDPARLEDLKASFQEVVTLNEAYRDLSRDRLA
jgi:hypothetical protein